MRTGPIDRAGSPNDRRPAQAGRFFYGLLAFRRLNAVVPGKIKGCLAQEPDAILHPLFRPAVLCIGLSGCADGECKARFAGKPGKTKQRPAPQTGAL